MSEPLLERRKRIDVIETGVPLLPWDEPGGCLLTGQVVTGVKVARVRSWRWQERGNLSPREDRPGVGPVGEREHPKQRNLRGAEYRCGAQGRTVS